MKLTYLATISAIALFTISCAKETASTTDTTTTDEPVAQEQVINESESTQSLAQTTTRSGTFVTAAKPSQGIVTVVTDDGQSYLEFDAEFRTGSGPDVFILLHRQENPQNYDEANYVNLGKMESTSGSQRYAIPSEVNLDDYKSVAIWCRKFGVTFGYAPLNTTSG